MSDPQARQRGFIRYSCCKRHRKVRAVTCYERNLNCWHRLRCSLCFIITLIIIPDFAKNNSPFAGFGNYAQQTKRIILTVTKTFFRAPFKAKKNLTHTSQWVCPPWHLSSAALVRSLRATRQYTSTGPPLISPGKETTLSYQRPVISQCGVFPFEGTVALLPFSQMWNSGFYHPVFGARRRGVGDEGSDFFLTWTHQSGEKQRVDRRVKGVLLGQLGELQRPV